MGPNGEEGAGKAKSTVTAPAQDDHLLGHDVLLRGQRTPPVFPGLAS